MEHATTFRSAVRGHAQAVVSGLVQPYDEALEIFGRSGREWPADDGDEARTSLLLLWGALTDWVELRPDEKSAAEAEMIAAAREWLAIEGDKGAEAAYFDRWVPRAEAPARP